MCLHNDSAFAANVSSASFSWSAAPSDAAPDAIYEYDRQTRPATGLGRLGRCLPLTLAIFLVLFFVILQKKIDP